MEHTPGNIWSTHIQDTKNTTFVSSLRCSNYFHNGSRWRKLVWLHDIQQWLWSCNVSKAWLGRRRQRVSLLMLWNNCTKSEWSKSTVFQFHLSDAVVTLNLGQGHKHVASSSGWQPPWRCWGFCWFGINRFAVMYKHNIIKAHDTAYWGSPACKVWKSSFKESPWKCRCQSLCWDWKCVLNYFWTKEKAYFSFQKLDPGKTLDFCDSLTTYFIYREQQICYERKRKEKKPGSYDLFASTQTGIYGWKKNGKKTKPLRQHVSLNCHNNANTKTNAQKKRQRKYTPKNMFLVYHKYFCVNRMRQPKWQLVSPRSSPSQGQLRMNHTFTITP